jgi:glucose-1-phosphate adenylyltransferase
MPDVVTMIMAGGQGRRLYPLTKMRSKPAVPIAGRFRLIDIPISNCIHSGLKRIFILTQFATESLHRHIFLTYRFDSFSKDFISILSAQQTVDRSDWYQGTADAVRQNLDYVRRQGRQVLILSGDHLYRMDYRRFLDFHFQHKAGITIAVYPVKAERASEYGILKIDRDLRIREFVEKPRDPAEIDRLAVPPETFREFGIDPAGRTHLASMGIYLFNLDVLDEVLRAGGHKDFGREVIPSTLVRGDVHGYVFDGYWEDIGTISSFYKANIALTEPLPRFNFYDEEKPIFTIPRFLPGSKILDSQVHSSILCEGSIINRSSIRHSIIGIRSRIGVNGSIERSVIMGADYFESQEQLQVNRQKGIPDIGIGQDCEIRAAIVDKNSRIGHGVRLINARGIQDENTENYSIVEGILVVPKHGIIHDGSVI